MCDNASYHITEFVGWCRISIKKFFHFHKNVVIQQTFNFHTVLSAEGDFLEPNEYSTALQGL